MKMSHERKILLFKSCLLVTYQPFVFYTYIFLIHKIHHKISTARNPDKHQPVVREQDNFLTEADHARQSWWWPLWNERQCHSTCFSFAPSSIWSSHRSWHFPAPWPCPASADSADALASLPQTCRSSSARARAGRITVNDRLRGWVRKEKRRKQERLWDTALRLWSRLGSRLTQRIQPPPRLLERCPVLWQFAVLQWVPRQTPAPRGQEASGERDLPRSEYPAAVRSLGSSTQLHSD